MPSASPRNELIKLATRRVDPGALAPACDTL
jgi:hypothetical protein